MPDPLGFYEHSRQSYGGLPLRDDADHEWMVGGYGDGVDERGEFRLVMDIRRPGVGRRSG